MSTVRLLDERSSPPLRAVIGRFMVRADTVDFAVSRIRLANLDLSAEEVTGPRRCRVLLGQLDASTLLDAEGAHQDAIARLDEWTRSGRLEVRSAGIAAWTPDFSLYGTQPRATCLLGAHYFGSPQLTVGPSFTVITEDRDAVDVLRARFDRLWEHSHDVLPAIVAVLERVRVGAAAGP